MEFLERMNHEEPMHVDHGRVDAQLVPRNEREREVEVNSLEPEPKRRGA